MALTIALSVFLEIALSFFLNAMSRFHTVLLIFRSNDGLYPLSLEETYFQVATLHTPNLTQPILTLAVTAASQPSLEFSQSLKQNPFTVSTSLHNFSIESTVLSFIPLHLEQTKCVANLAVTLFILAHRP